MRIVVTGGAGYIGSHACVLLLEAGHDVCIVDTFANAGRDVPDRVGAIAGRPAEVAEADITDRAALDDVMGRFRPDAVIHFAGLKAVGESGQIPLEYYRVNIAGSVTLMQAMEAAGCKRLVFSSSATVYGDPDLNPIPEDHPLRPTNPYGRTKRMVEEIIRDWGRADPQVSAVALRYFNPVGAHPSGRIGEAPQGTPNNLMPYVAQVAMGDRETLSIFGDDYDTPDGTGVRDFIHVTDLAAAHLAALDLTGRETGVEAINIGTGKGHSVLDMIRAFEAVSSRKVPYVITKRRPGDVGISLADPARAADRLAWRAEKTLDDMCADAWRWQSAARTG
jgi:UDP-glucose 4-epimerase